MPELVRHAKFHIDHIISTKHGGGDDSENLCLACAPCNRCKGADIAANDPLTEKITRLFNPRLDTWDDHFRIYPDGALGERTPEGRATIVLLRINQAPRIEQRNIERLLGNYPCQNNPSP